MLSSEHRYRSPCGQLSRPFRARHKGLQGCHRHQSSAIGERRVRVDLLRFCRPPTAAAIVRPLGPTKWGSGCNGTPREQVPQHPPESPRLFCIIIIQARGDGVPGMGGGGDRQTGEPRAAARACRPPPLLGVGGRLSAAVGPLPFPAAPTRSMPPAQACCLSLLQHQTPLWPCCCSSVYLTERLPQHRLNGRMKHHGAE